MRYHAFRLNSLSAAVLTFAALAASQARAAAAPAPAASAASDAAPQQVVISADASKDGLKVPYAGGQVARGGRVGILGSEDVMDTPFAITNYTSKLIQDQQSASIADVLQNDPAVRVTRGYGNFQQAYMVRGLVIYSDDISYNGLYGLLPRQYLAAELVERVEVLRGASAFINGAAPGGSGLGGAVNISPKRAPNAPMAEITTGWNDGQVYESADVANRFGSDKALGLRANIVHRSGDSSAIDGENNQLDAALLGADFHTGDLRLSADFGYQNNKQRAVTPSITIASGLAIPKAPDASHQIAQPWTYSNERDTFGTLRAEYDIRPNLTAWAAGGFREGREANELEGLTVTAADGTVSLSSDANTRKDSIRTGEIGLRGSFATGAVKHAVVGSYGVYEANSKNAYAFSTTTEAAGTIYDTAFVPVLAQPYTGDSQLDDPKRTSRTLTRSIALADTLSFLDDRFLLTIGGRRQQIEGTSFSYATGEQSSEPNTASRVTPVAGLVFKLNQQVSFYTTYVEGLVAGDFAPTTYKDDQGTEHQVTNGGEAMKPYVTKQGEIGVKVDTGSYGGTLDVFQSRKPSYALVGDTFRQSDTQRNRGVELSVYGEAMPGVRVLGGASYLAAVQDDKTVIGSPKSQFNLGFDFDVPAVDGLALTVRGVYTAKQFADEANTQVVPSWTRFDVGARYVMDVGAHAVTLRAGIDNLANRNYWASSGGYPGYGYLVLGAPRTYTASATFSY